MEPKHIGEQIRQLLREGVSNREIRKKLNCAAATISYHASKIGLRQKRRPTYDWPAIKRTLMKDFQCMTQLKNLDFQKARGLRLRREVALSG